MWFWSLHHLCVWGPFVSHRMTVYAITYSEWQHGILHNLMFKAWQTLISHHERVICIPSLINDVLTWVNAFPHLTVLQTGQRCGTPTERHQNHHGGEDPPDPCKTPNYMWSTTGRRTKRLEWNHQHAESQISSRLNEIVLTCSTEPPGRTHAGLDSPSCCQYRLYSWTCGGASCRRCWHDRWCSCRAGELLSFLWKWKSSLKETWSQLSESHCSEGFKNTLHLISDSEIRCVQHIWGHLLPSAAQHFLIKDWLYKYRRVFAQLVCQVWLRIRMSPLSKLVFTFPQEPRY